MKKLFAIVAVIGAFTFGSIQLAQAQDAPAAEQTEQQAAPAAEATTATAPAAEEGGIHKEIKVKFIEGTASFMSLVAIDRKSTRLNSSHTDSSRMPSSA